MLQYLLNPFIQVQDKNGLSIAGAKIYVRDSDTDDLATTYSDFEGTMNTNPVLTDVLGNATVIADDSKLYDVSIYDNNDIHLFTKKYLKPGEGASPEAFNVVAGFGINVSVEGNTFIVSVDTDLIPTFSDLAGYQEKLTGGDNIEVTTNNIINVTGRRQIATQYPITGVLSDATLTIGLDESEIVKPYQLDGYLTTTQYEVDSATFLTGFATNVVRQKYDSVGAVASSTQAVIPISLTGANFVYGSVDVSSTDGYVGIFGCSAIENSASVYALSSYQTVFRQIPTADYTTINFCFNTTDKNLLNVAIKGSEVSSVDYKNFCCFVQ